MALLPFAMMKTDHLRGFLPKSAQKFSNEPIIFDHSAYQLAPPFPLSPLFFHPAAPIKPTVQALMASDPPSARANAALLSLPDRRDQMAKAYSIFASMLSQRNPLTSPFLARSSVRPETNASAFKRLYGKPSAYQSKHASHPIDWPTPPTKSLRRGPLKHQRKKGSIFRRGGRVHLANGSAQRVECLQMEDFFKSWTAQEEKLSSVLGLHWAIVERIGHSQMYSTPTSSSSPFTVNPKEIKIRFRIQSSAVGENHPNQFPVTFQKMDDSSSVRLSLFNYSDLDLSLRIIPMAYLKIN